MEKDKFKKQLKKLKLKNNFLKEDVEFLEQRVNELESKSKSKDKNYRIFTKSMLFTIILISFLTYLYDVFFK